MNQLGELKRNAAEKFSAHGAEVIVIFREEQAGVDGLTKIKNKTEVEFTLGLDTDAEQTAAYSPGKMEFANYVLDKRGIIRGVIDGTKTTRAQSVQLLEVLDALEQPADANASAADDKAAVERAILDYVEGIYDVKPELIERGVHPQLTKLGYWRKAEDTEFQPGSGMTFEQLRDLAANYNKEGRIPKDAPKKVEVLDVMEKIASAKLTADWGTDLFHLVKEDGKWKILQVVWQSPAKK